MYLLQTNVLDGGRREGRGRVYIGILCVSVDELCHPSAVLGPYLEGIKPCTESLVRPSAKP